DCNALATPPPARNRRRTLCSAKLFGQCDPTALPVAREFLSLFSPGPRRRARHPAESPSREAIPADKLPPAPARHRARTSRRLTAPASTDARFFERSARQPPRRDTEIG